MASTASPEASEIRRRGRRRVIGAIALVMLLVVFVPMLLDSEPRPARTGPTLAIPPRANAPALPAPAPAKTETAQPTAPASATAVAPDKATRGQAPAGAQSPLQGFAVQVGAFRDETMLKQSREKLAAAGVVHYIERLDAKAGPLTRLRAGPFATREEAESALVKLKLATLDGKVVTLP